MCTAVVLNWLTEHVYSPLSVFFARSMCSLVITSSLDLQKTEHRYATLRRRERCVVSFARGNRGPPYPPHFHAEICNRAEICAILGRSVECISRLSEETFASLKETLAQSRACVWDGNAEWSKNRRRERHPTRRIHRHGYRMKNRA